MRRIVFTWLAIGATAAALWAFARAGGFAGDDPWTIAGATIVILLTSRRLIALCDFELLANPRLKAMTIERGHWLGVAALAVLAMTVNILLPLGFLMLDGPWFDAVMLVFFACLPSALFELLRFVAVMLPILFSDLERWVRSADLEEGRAPTPMDAELQGQRLALRSALMRVRDVVSARSGETVELRDVMGVVLTQAWINYFFVVSAFGVATFLLETRFGFELTLGEAEWGRIEYALFPIAFLIDLATLGVLEHYDISIASLTHDPDQLVFSTVFLVLKSLGVFIVVANISGAGRRYVEVLERDAAEQAAGSA